ncbi:MAG: chemotaxis protein CheA [Dethiobacter sp.]|jgi:two-component system chemotaxis sensor kinase CheA|nr:chemotaxis protein CheA [Dethiobacter sp.]
MDMLAYADLFQAEAGEYMHTLNRCLLSMEKDPHNSENLLEAFRAVHSLKGMAGAMGYKQVADLAHGLENFLEDLKAKLFFPSAEVLDLVFEAVDLLQISLNNPQESSIKEQQKVQRILLNIKSFQQVITDPGPVLSHKPENGGLPAPVLSEMERELIRQIRRRGESPSLVRVTLRQDTAMKSVRSYMVLRALEERGEIICTMPSRKDLDEENFNNQFQVCLLLNGEVKPEQLEKMLLKVSDVEQATIAPWAESDSLEKPVEFSPAEQGAAGYTVSSAAEKMVRVETQKLDDLVNLVGEMVVARTHINKIGRGYSEELDNILDRIKRVITSLQDTAMKLRMVPIKQVFDRFPRMMRDICRDKNKEVRLLISGEHTELDRSIINQLPDPLVHLLRNAADHGIERPELRLAAGKDPVGTVLLKARHEGNQMVIVVEDNGAGIDPDIVRKKALEKGIISEDDAARMSEKDVIQLIFRSGFSTSDQVTDVSGRGVGMDVVRKSIEELHGSIDVESKPGEMTRFVLRLPLTLAIIKSLMVRTSGQIYAIPLELVRCNVYLKTGDLKTVCGHPAVNLRGEVIPLYELSDLLGFGRRKENVEEMSVVIVDTGGKTKGLIVDELIGQQEILIKSIGAFCHSLQGIAGATVLGDGSISLIVDVAALTENGRVGH